jgi:hypothetical protein
MHHSPQFIPCIAICNAFYHAWVYSASTRSSVTGTMHAKRDPGKADHHTQSDRIFSECTRMDGDDATHKTRRRRPYRVWMRIGSSEPSARTAARSRRYIGVAHDKSGHAAHSTYYTGRVTVGAIYMHQFVMNSSRLAPCFLPGRMVSITLAVEYTSFHSVQYTSACISSIFFPTSPKGPAWRLISVSRQVFRATLDFF